MRKPGQPPPASGPRSAEASGCLQSTGSWGTGELGGAGGSEGTASWLPCGLLEEVGKSLGRPPSGHSGFSGPGPEEEGVGEEERGRGVWAVALGFGGRAQGLTQGLWPLEAGPGAQ